MYYCEPDGFTCRLRRQMDLLWKKNHPFHKANRPADDDDYHYKECAAKSIPQSSSRFAPNKADYRDLGGIIIARRQWPLVKTRPARTCNLGAHVVHGSWRDAKSRNPPLFLVFTKSWSVFG